ncbi:Protein FIP1 [Bienertia sinuspersici]
MPNARNSASPTTAEENLFLDILNDAPLAAHRKPTRIYGSYAIVGIGAPWIFKPLEAWISPLLCSCNVILLLITGIFQQYLVYQVKKIRLQGYYKLSQRLKHIVRLPYATISYVISHTLCSH